MDIWGLAGSSVQLSHTAKSLPSVSPRREPELLAQRLTGFRHHSWRKAIDGSCTRAIVELGWLGFP